MTGTNVTELRAEIVAEVTPVIREEIMREITRQKMNKDIISGVLSEYSDEYGNFQWKKDKTVTKPWDGTLFTFTDHGGYPYQIRTAMSTLLKAYFQVKRIEHIPYEKRDEAKALIESILKVLEKERNVK